MRWKVTGDESRVTRTNTLHRLHGSTHVLEAMVAFSQAFEAQLRKERDK